MEVQKITAFLTFKERGEEAMKFYVSLFKKARVVSAVRSEGGPIPRGGLLHGIFEIDGQQFMAMDGGPYFSFEQGFSMFVNCADQDEVDRLWDRLCEGGEIQMCGWLKDRYGVSWQIIPKALGELLGDMKTPAQARAMEAMLKMKKIIIKDLEEAYKG